MTTYNVTFVTNDSAPIPYAVGTLQLNDDNTYALNLRLTSNPLNPIQTNGSYQDFSVAGFGIIQLESSNDDYGSEGLFLKISYNSNDAFSGSLSITVNKEVQTGLFVGIDM